MFGIAFFFILTVYFAYWMIKDDKTNRNNKRDAMFNGGSYGTYYDHAGKLRDIDTNEVMFMDCNWLCNESRTKVVNIRMAELENKFVDSCRNLKNGQNVVYYDNWNYETSMVKKTQDSAVGISGIVYKHVETGELYFLKSLRWDIRSLEERKYKSPSAYEKCGTFFVNIRTGMIENVKGDNEYVNGCYDENIEFVESYNGKQGCYKVYWRDKYLDNKAKRVVMEGK